MRDNHDGLPEILKVTDVDGCGFCLIQLEREGQLRRYRFGLDRDGFRSLTKALQLRPFDQKPGARYRYFFVPSVSKLDKKRVITHIRCELGKLGKEIEVEAPIQLVANLMWFFELKDWGAAEEFRVD